MIDYVIDYYKPAPLVVCSVLEGRSLVSELLPLFEALGSLGLLFLP